MRKRKEAPSTIFLKAIVIYTTEETQRPADFKNMGKTQIIKFIEDSYILDELSNEYQKELRLRTLGYALKMLIHKLGDRIDIRTKDTIEVYKNGIKVYDVDDTLLDLSNATALSFKMFCIAGEILNVISKCSIVNQKGVEQLSIAV